MLHHRHDILVVAQSLADFWVEWAVGDRHRRDVLMRWMPLVARVDPHADETFEQERSRQTRAPANTHSDERNGAMVLAGAELYDALYATGYHANGNTSRAHELIEYLTTTNVSIAARRDFCA